MDHPVDNPGVETPKATSSLMDGMKSVERLSGNHVDVNSPTEGGIKPHAQVSKAVHQLKGGAM